MHRSIWSTSNAKWTPVRTPFSRSSSMITMISCTSATAAEPPGFPYRLCPGLLPILSLNQIQRITSMCRAKLPTELVRRLQRFAEDPQGQIGVGIAHATAQCEGLLTAGVPGIHFYVLNQSDTTCRILRRLDLAAGANEAELGE